MNKWKFPLKHWTESGTTGWWFTSCRANLTSLPLPNSVGLCVYMRIYVYMYVCMPACMSVCVCWRVQNGKCEWIHFWKALSLSCLAIIWYLLTLSFRACSKVPPGGVSRSLGKIPGGGEGGEGGGETQQKVTAFKGLQQPPSRGSWLREAGASRLGADEAAGGRCLFLSTWLAYPALTSSDALGQHFRWLWMSNNVWYSSTPSSQRIAYSFGLFSSSLMGYVRFMHSSLINLRY